MLDIFYGEVIHGFQAEAQRLGYQVLLHMFDRTQERFESIVSSLRDEVQGFIVANDGDITSDMIAQAHSIQLPLVLIENHVAGQRIPCVLGDNFVAGYTVTRHLLALGHRAVAVLQGPTKYSSLVDRLRGCLAAAAEANLLIPAEWMPAPMGGPFERGYLQMEQILRLPERPTAVVAIHDRSAFGAYEAIKEAGLRIPEDIAIVSIDDVAESAHTRPALTSFRIRRDEMGILAMHKLHRLINGEPEVPAKSIVYGELVVRESCGARLSEQQE
jgi:LacI family transcriptional regulator